MSENPTREEILASIVPNSLQLNAEDMLTGPQTFTITDVKRGTAEQPIYICLSETDKQFRPCKTVRRIMIALWSDDPRNWHGQRITLFVDHEVKYAGVKVGGLRVSHASGLEEPKTFMLTATRGKRSEFKILPLPETKTSDEDVAYIYDVRGEIEAAETMETLKAIGIGLKSKSKAVQDAVRAAYSQRSKDIKEL